MKCLSCGSENPVAVKFCEYCGTALSGQTAISHAAGTPRSAAQPVSAPSAASGLWPRLSDPIFHLWREPNGPSFRWLAFFFPVAYLAGYRAERAAIGLTFVFMGLYLAASILAVASAKLGGLFLFATVIFYGVKVAFAADRLIQREGGFQWGPAIGFQLIYMVLYGGLAVILE
jgi:hypothetical protein